MRVNYRVIGASILLVISIIGCGRTGTKYEYPPADGRVVGVVHGIVQDRNTYEKLGSVAIAYLVDGDIRTVTTDTLGYYYIKDLFSGEYELTVRASSQYAISKVTIYVPTLEDIGATMPSGEDFPYSIVENIYMQKKNAGLTGTLYARKNPQELAPASGATVIADFSNWGIEPALYETLTDADGVFTFDQNLPATAYTYIYTLPFTLGGVEYAATASYNRWYLTPEATIIIDDIIVDPAAREPILLYSPSGMTDFPVSGDIQLVFSKAMNTSTFDCELHRDYSYGTELFFDHSWSSDNMTLTIDPYVILRDGTTYALVLSGESEDNAPFDDVITFQTEGVESFELIRTNLEVIDGYYTNEFPVSGNIELEFNMAVDTSGATIALRDNSTYLNVTCILQLSADEKTITINPVTNLAYGTNHRLYYELYSQSGYYDSRSIYFDTANQ
ncbi:MAG: Ig-like domain-containing protein [Fidelibacterota bacterium]|nr:MAG: Ig-like domain-containing protein [Candidatus Neomarinimicrobiota bacterium]